jgi:hypothetical protein
MIHQRIGFTEESPFLIAIDKMPEYEKKHGNKIKFAIWRDPIERILSTYKLFCLEKEYRAYFHYLGLYEDISFDRFMAFLEFEWGKIKTPLSQDEHIRRQVDYYKSKQVDFILPIQKMYNFLNEHNVNFVNEQSNKTNAHFETNNQIYINKIRDYYNEDYGIKCNF